ncbi:unnamed protein product, partial [Brassica napus]
VQRRSPNRLSQRHVPLGVKLLPRVGNRAAGACVASSPDSDLEALSHNPATVASATLAFQPAGDQLCESTVP